MRLLSEDRELVLKQLYINLLLFDSFFLHDFDREGLATTLVHTESDYSKCSLAQRFSEHISLFNISHFLKLLIVIDMEGLRLFN